MGWFNKSVKSKRNKNQLYVDLMKKVLIDFHRVDQIEYHPLLSHQKLRLNTQLRKSMEVIESEGFFVGRRATSRVEDRLNGRDWPPYAESMIGWKRMSNLEYCIDQILLENIPGDIMETGVWRGGACIFMAAMLKAYGIKDRKVWVADSFQGLPKPNEYLYEADRGDMHHSINELSVSLETVRKNFEKFDLLADNVMFLKGWFSETLPGAPIDRLALLRLDGDMYESTIDALTNLYPKLVSGGYLIVDDWGAVPACRKAVRDYREANGIGEEIVEVDWTGVYWRKR